MVALRSDEEQIKDLLVVAADAARDFHEVPVAAALVKDGRLFSAANEKERRPDPTAHAELLVLQTAAQAFGTWRLTGATVYITKEPCMMCAGALIAARVTRVVFGAYDPKAGAAGSVVDLFSSQAANHRIVVEGGVCAEQAGAQLSAYFRAKRG